MEVSRDARAAALRIRGGELLEREGSPAFRFRSSDNAWPVRRRNTAALRPFRHFVVRQRQIAGHIGLRLPDPEYVAKRWHRSFICGTICPVKSGQQKP